MDPPRNRELTEQTMSDDNPRQHLLELVGSLRGHIESINMMGVDMPRKQEVGGPFEWPEPPERPDDVEVVRPPDEVEGDPAERLQALYDEIKECHTCPYADTRTNLVFGDGDARARLMFIGEAPGADEDASGTPFVGRAGQLLNKIIKAMGLEREEVYIANILKCRPPGNATPSAEDRHTCGPYLTRQIEIIRPEIIVTLGAVSTQYLLDTTTSIGKLRGRFHDFMGARVMPTYHPAYLLRYYSETNRRKVWDDMQKVMKALGIT